MNERAAHQYTQSRVFYRCNHSSESNEVREKLCGGLSKEVDGTLRIAINRELAAIAALHRNVSICQLALVQEKKFLYTNSATSPTNHFYPVDPSRREVGLGVKGGRRRIKLWWVRTTADKSLFIYNRLQNTTVLLTFI